MWIFMHAAITNYSSVSMGLSNFLTIYSSVILIVSLVGRKYQESGVSGSFQWNIWSACLVLSLPAIPTLLGNFNDFRILLVGQKILRKSTASI